MKEVTVIILTKEDSDVIEEAIKSAKLLTSEIIVIDANSDDQTRHLAQKMGATVIKHPFKDFSDQRNFAFLQTTSPWVLYLDSDEKITEEFSEEVLNTIKNYDPKGSIGGFFIRRKTYYFGQDWKFEDKVQRLFYRERFVEWRGVVHETPVIHGEFGLIKSPVFHFTHRNLSQMVRKTNEWSEYEAKLRFKNNHPAIASWRIFRVMATEFFNSYIKNNGYKNGAYGLIEAMYQAFSIFITYAKLWEMQQKSKKR